MDPLNDTRISLEEREHREQREHQAGLPERTSSLAASSSDLHGILSTGAQPSKGTGSDGTTNMDAAPRAPTRRLTEDDIYSSYSMGNSTSPPYPNISLSTQQQTMTNVDPSTRTPRPDQGFIQPVHPSSASHLSEVTPTMPSSATLGTTDSAAFSDMSHSNTASRPASSSVYTHTGGESSDLSSQTDGSGMDTMLNLGSTGMYQHPGSQAGQVPSPQPAPPPLDGASAVTSPLSQVPPPPPSNNLEQGDDQGGREPISFDEGILRALCDSPYALQLITERIKQSIASCKQFAAFLRSRADLEDKYARSSLELKKMSEDGYSKGQCKAGSFLVAYKKSLDVHDSLAQNRARFAQRLYEMSDELVNLAKEGERLRKQHKDNGARYEKQVLDAEQALEKAKYRFDTTAEELERILIAKEGENVKDAGSMIGHHHHAGAPPHSSSKDRRGIGKAITKGGMLFKSKGPAQMQKQEDEVRARMNTASEVFRKAVATNQQTRAEWFNLHLPKVLRASKECADEIDMGTQYHMARYAYLYESTVLADAAAVAPANPQEGGGLRAMVETIDNRADFTKYMQNYNAARGPVPVKAGGKREYEEGFMPALPPHVQASQMNQANVNGMSNPRSDSSSNLSPAFPGAYTAHSSGSGTNHSGMTFGVDLSDQVVSEGTEVPKVVEKCAEAIEAFGLDSMGIYRLSGTTSKVQRLKAALDADLDAVDVMSDEWSGDINVVSSALKQWFRELPEPLLTHALYQGFIDAARYDNDRLRHIRLHEQVNELPDANYATLKYFMGHLNKIREKESINQMSVSNLSIVFGPTLLGAPPSMGGLNLEHMSFQCKAIETILERYKEIFVEEEEEASVPDGQPS